MIEIRPITAEDTYSIRKEELRKNVSLSHEMAGDYALDTVHLGIYYQDELAGIVSMMKASIPFFDDNPQYQIRGMATSAPFQGKGLGKRLLKEAEKRLKVLGVNFVWCNARVVARDFYLKAEYSIHGSVFELPEIGLHYKMYKRL
jgi:GNAT superfamily N-acetyltransferase